MYVSILMVRMVLSEVRRRGLPDETLLRSGAIDREALTDLRATVSVEEFGALLSRAQELCTDPAFGLTMGEHWSVNMLQVLGHLLMTCPSMREALTMFQHFQPLIDDNVRWSLEEHGELGYVFFDPTCELPAEAKIAFEAMMVFTHGLGKQFVAAEQEHAHEVWFRHAAPTYTAQYLRLFRCPVRFDQPRYALIFPRAFLDAKQAHADSAMRRVLEDSAEQLLRERKTEGSVAVRVRGLLRYEEYLGDVDGQKVARRLGMNLRTLRRRLGAEGSPLTDLLDEARYEQAQRALTRPSVSIKEVAHALGFSEASAFHRAFKRWSGRTPAEYIRQHGDHDVRAAG